MLIETNYLQNKNHDNQQIKAMLKCCKREVM